jgi:hypothetical protein
MAQLEVKLVASGAQAEVQVIASDDLVSWALGTDKDIVFFPRSTSLNANTALAVGGDDVLVGTPVTSALAANSLILSNTTASGDYMVALNRGGNSEEYIFADASAGKLRLVGPNGNITLDPTSDVVIDGNRLFVNETANANMGAGITIQLAGNNDHAFTLKTTTGSFNTGLTTGVAAQTVESDDFFFIVKSNADLGGVILSALAEDGALTSVFGLQSLGGTASTTKTSGGQGLMALYIGETSGGTIANVTADGNIFSIRTRVGGASITRLILDEDGDIFVTTVVDIAASTGTNVPVVTAFDEYDDAMMLRAFDTGRHASGIVRSEFDSFVRYNEESLLKIGVLGAPVDEGGLWNLNQHVRLLTGAAWQAAEDITSIARVLCGILTPDQQAEASQILTPRLHERLAAMEAG